MRVLHGDHTKAEKKKKSIKKLAYFQVFFVVFEM